MNLVRTLAQVRGDLVLQQRNGLYRISLIVGVVGGVALYQLTPAEMLGRTYPAFVLMFVGGTTLLYMVGMLSLERAEGTLRALSTSPLTPAEYLIAKCLSLTCLALIESGVMLGIAIGWLLYRGEAFGVSPSLLDGFLGLLALVALSLVHVLGGVWVAAPRPKITEALVPMGALALLFQAPILGAFQLVDPVVFLPLPSGAPTLMLTAAAHPPNWELWFSLGLSLIWVGVLGWMAKRSFETFVLGIRRGEDVS